MIDLLNVSFDGESAPDRISAKAGVKELRKVAPLRRFSVWLPLKLASVMIKDIYLSIEFSILFLSLCKCKCVGNTGGDLFILMLIYQS